MTYNWLPDQNLAGPHCVNPSNPQIEVVRYLVSNLSIINPRQIAIWGWSYGGYVTLRALSDEDQDVFQCGIAVAPVTNWRYYGRVQLMSFLTKPNFFIRDHP